MPIHSEPLLWPPTSRGAATPCLGAGHGSHPAEVIDTLVDWGAWLTLRTAASETPLDLVKRTDQLDLMPMLLPVLEYTVRPRDLRLIEEQFHEIIIDTTFGPLGLVKRFSLRLPQLEPLLEIVDAVGWFPVPGMYGGFRYELEVSDSRVWLVPSSWCRICEGSGVRYLITPVGSTLVEVGFDSGSTLRVIEERSEGEDGE